MVFTARSPIAKAATVLLTALALTACAGLPFMHSASTPTATTSSNTDNRVARATLDNGLQVVIVQNHMAPVVTTVMNYAVGSRETPPGFPGRAHALEHMMFRGSKGLSADQISAIAAAMGGDFNAMTRQDATQYFFTVPKQYLGVALHMSALRMRSILATEKDWKKERGAIEQEVSRDNSSPSFVAYTQILKQLFKDTPYAHSPLGTRPSFNKTTAQMLKSFYAKWYVPNNATLVIAGDVDADKALAKVKKLFGDIQSHTLPERPATQLQPVDTTPIHKSTDKGYGLIMLAYRLPGYDSDDYAGARVLAQVIGNQRGPLYSKLVPTGEALDTGFQLQGMRPGAIGFGLVAFARATDPKPLVKQTRSILDNIAKNGVPANLVQAAKRKIATSAESTRDSIQGLAMHWSNALVLAQATSPAARLKAIQDVTVGDVNRLAKQYLQAGNSVLAVLTPKDSGKPSSSSGFGGQESFTPSHVKNVKLPAWAAQPLAQIQAPANPVKPTVQTLKNGLQVIVKPVHTSQVIHVYGHIRHQAELQTPAGQEGVNRVLDSLLNYGTQSLDRKAYQAALDKIGASASAGTRFGLTVLKDHFDDGMQLLADNQLHPRLPENIFQVVKRQVAGAVAGEIQSPDFHLQQGVKQRLYPATDPSLRHATPASVSGLTYKDVTGYYDSVFRPDLTTIVIIGNIKPEAALAAVKTSFGKWQAEGNTPNVDLDAVPANKTATFHVPDNAKTQDKVIMAQTMGLTVGDPDYDALLLGNQVLSGGFYASRLYRELRGERGLVYYVHSGFNSKRKRANLQLVFGSDPDKVNPASQLIVRALQKMQKEPVSAEELHRAKAALVRQVPLHHASVGAIGRGLLNRVDLGLPLDSPTRRARHYLELNATDIQNAFKKWVRPNALVRGVEGPKPTS